MVTTSSMGGQSRSIQSSIPQFCFFTALPKGLTMLPSIEEGHTGFQAWQPSQCQVHPLGKYGWEGKNSSAALSAAAPVRGLHHPKSATQPQTFRLRLLSHFSVPGRRHLTRLAQVER